MIHPKLLTQLAVFLLKSALGLTVRLAFLPEAI